MAKTALVTGAGSGAVSGIGRGLALALARRGYHLLLAGRDAARLEAAANELAAFSTASIYPVDLSDPLARAEFITTLLARQGAPGLLIHNAAVMPAGDFLQRSGPEIAAAFQVNLLAPAELTRQFCGEAAPPEGVIFILSTAARFPQPYNSLYCASKSGLRALAEALQVELSGQTRVCLAYPPITATPMTARFDTAGPNARQSAAWRWQVPKSDPLVVAERILRGYEAGQDEIAWLDWEVLPGLFYRLAPRLFRWILTRQRRALQRLFTRPDAPQR